MPPQEHHKQLCSSSLPASTSSSSSAYNCSSSPSSEAFHLGDSYSSLLLSVLVEVVSSACRSLLSSSSSDETTYYQFASNSVSPDLPSLSSESVDNHSIFRELLLAGAREDLNLHSLQKKKGYGYPENVLVKFCEGLCHCAFTPRNVPELPRLEMEGVKERNPFREKNSTFLLYSISHIVNHIDDNIDLMNSPACTALTLLTGFYNCFLSLLTIGQPFEEEPIRTNDEQFVVLQCNSGALGGTPRIPVRLPRECIMNMRWLLVSLGCDRILYLTGLRCTTGSLRSHCIPSRDSLIGAFNLPNLYCSNSFNLKSKSILTVGARALCKHAPRSKEGFWTRSGDTRSQKEGSGSAGTTLSGSEAAKNKKAEEKLREILDNCVWINLHVMLDAGCGNASKASSNSQHDVADEFSSSSVCILEVREASGYGARWSCDYTSSLQQQVADQERSTGLLDEMHLGPPSSITFRGFVEPMSRDGHENKWKH